MRLTLSLGSELREKEREKKSKSSDNGVCIKAIKKISEAIEREKHAVQSRQGRTDAKVSAQCRLLNINQARINK